MRARIAFFAVLALFLSSGAVQAAICTALCGSDPVATCSAPGECFAYDRNCTQGQRGAVNCGAGLIFCASPCPCSADSWCDTSCSYDPDCEDCSANGVCNSNCSYDPDCEAYNPCGSGPQPGTGCYFNWNPQTQCCVPVAPELGCSLYCP